MRHPRSSGLLLHPTSLPGPFGIGDIGPMAHSFVDFLAMAGQSLWQVLPLGPTSFGDSPYQCLSSFAGNPNLISPEALAEAGLVTAEELAAYPRFDDGRIRFGPAIEAKQALLREVHRHWEGRASQTLKDRFSRFVRGHAQAGWLEDFALFMALKAAHQGAPWPQWPAAIRDRDAGALDDARRRLAHDIGYHLLCQFLFREQWDALRQRAALDGIKLVGDIPIFVAYDSADVWRDRSLFQLDDQGRPKAVAGVPPDYFSRTGQLWGNPLYDWQAVADDDYQWWARRLGHALSLCDILRLDHFRGFEAYWAVPAGAPTAESGAWEPGPGQAFLDAMRRHLGHLPLIAEDLGVITPPVAALRDDNELPGMRILQFAWDGKATNDFLPHRHDPRSVVYTGTHDNATTRGWWQGASKEERARVAAYLGKPVDDPAWALIELGMRSPADQVIIPLQDLLSLGDEGRMNLPGAAEGNWGWRLGQPGLSEAIARRLGDLTRTYGRWPA